MPCSEIGTIVSRLAINQTTWRTEIALIRKKWSASHAREKFFRRNTRYEIRPAKACSGSSILLKSVNTSVISPAEAVVTCCVTFTPVIIGGVPLVAGVGALTTRMISLELFALAVGLVPLLPSFVLWWL